MATIEENSKMSPEKLLADTPVGTDVEIGKTDGYYTDISRDKLQEMITWTKHTRKDFEVFQEKRQKRRDRPDVCAGTAVLWFCMLGVALGIVSGYLATKLNTYEGWLAWIIFPAGVVLFWQYLRHNYKINGDLID